MCYILFVPILSVVWHWCDDMEMEMGMGDGVILEIMFVRWCEGMFGYSGVDVRLSV